MEKQSALPGLRNARIEANLTQAELAAILHIPLSTFNGWGTGARDPRCSVLPTIAAALDCPMERLFDPTPLPQQQRYLGKRIRRERKKRGLTLETVAKRMGVTRQRVQQLETKKSFSPENVKRVAAAIGCTVDELFGDE